MNGKPIHTKPITTLDKALIVAETGSDRGDAKRNAVSDCESHFKSEPLINLINFIDHHQVINNVLAIGFKCHGVRQMGSAALTICHIAEGSVDAYYEFGIHCWDMAGGVAVLREAGGCVIDTKGGEFQLMNRRLIAAATPQLAKLISDTMVVHLDMPSD